VALWNSAILRELQEARDGRGEEGGLNSSIWDNAQLWYNQGDLSSVCCLLSAVCDT
jgi:hypothetical protein